MSGATGPAPDREVVDDQAALDEHVRRLVAQAPPLTAEQRSRLSALLAPTP